MPDALVVRSHLREYRVRFVDDFAASLAQLVEIGAFVVADAGVWALHADRLERVVPADRRVTLQPDEHVKTLDGVERLVELLMERRFRRNQRLVALGGGVIQDLTGFTASILYRGVEWVFVPTTLLAQADSCVGSKTSINVGEAKNIAGGFYPPSEILVDTRFLCTLPEVEIRSGIGEMMHFFVYADSPFLDRLAAEYDELLADRDRLLPFIAESLAIKKPVAEADEFDRGERNKFNYGHTFGHALESLTGYRLRHGQAVTVGMDLANRLSVEHGLLSEAEFDDLHRILRVNIPEHDWSALDLDRYLELLSRDKKNTGAELTCILCRGRGRLEKRTLPLDGALRGVVEGYFAGLASAKAELHDGLVANRLGSREQGMERHPDGIQRHHDVPAT